MKTTKALSLLVLVAYSTGALASDYKGPGTILSASDNQSVFAKHCTGTADSTDVPGVNYESADVMRAAKILSRVADKSFYFYSDIKRMYVTKEEVAPVAGISKSAHTFLKLLCGEFRDRAGMIESKIKWVHNMVMPGQEAQPTTIDMNKNIWAHLSGAGYNKYLQLSRSIYNAKSNARTEFNITFGSNSQAETKIPGYTVCETKYIFSEYLGKAKSFDDYATYQAGLNTFSEKCSVADREDYYDFRGDANFKPNSPESNAMIWHSQSVAKNCSDTKTSKDAAKFSSDICEQYFRKPFLSRFKAARSAMATWLLRDISVDSQFANEGSNVTIHPNIDTAVGTKPFQYSFDGSNLVSKLMPGIDMSASDMGFNSITGIGTDKANTELAYMRLRDAVNRHTDWYSSGYNDGLGVTKDQAYSMFVATSYEMSESNSFTAPGYTVPGEGDGFKHWMFVFRVKKDNWYTPESLRANLKYDPDTMWLDETSFGTNGLADGEKAWDRLGSPLEGELDSIIYLHNISEYGETTTNNKLED